MQTRVRIKKPAESVTPRGVAEINVREALAFGLDCAHCPRESLSIVNGVLVWKSAHGKHVHANAVTLSVLLQIYVSRANAATLKDLRGEIDRRLEALAA